MHTPQDYFRMGAEAMRAEISVRLGIAANWDWAIKVMQMPLPKYQEPEAMTIEGPNPKERGR